MRDAVRRVFYDFNRPMEGDVPHLYVDVKGLVSIGVGLLCDPIQLAMNLPLVHADGTPATRAEIATEWLRIKNLPPDARGRTAAQLGHLYARPHTTLRLTEEGLRETLARKLHHMDQQIAMRFVAYETWPADAQLGVLSLAWACGPAFRFPRLERALKVRDFTTAAVECFMPEEATISGLRPRNRANRALFRNAAQVERNGIDPDLLWWPRDLEVPIGPDDETLPSTPPPAEGIVDFPIVHPLSYDLSDDDDDEPPEAA